MIAELTKQELRLVTDVLGRYADDLREGEWAAGDIDHTEASVMSLFEKFKTAWSQAKE